MLSNGHRNFIQCHHWKGALYWALWWIVVNSKAVIGSYCNLSQGVTIGEGGRAEQRGTPVIGDKVYIGAGAKIFGKIQVGDNAAIGANSVVPKSIPDNAVACGVPAKVINFKSSSAFIQNCDKASLGG
jgi:serine O-acetyltransferase